MAWSLSKQKEYSRITGSGDDTLLTDLSESATRICKNILGLAQDADLPDNKNTDLALQIIVTFFYENRAFLGKALPETIWQVVNQILCQDRNPTAFMPSVREDSA